MTSLIVLVVIAAIVFFAVRHICKEKKRGAVCVGCPHAGTCGKSACSCADEAK